MIEVVIVLDYSPNKVPQDLFNRLCEKSYIPLLNVFSDLMMPVVHGISGRVLERFHTQRQDKIISILQNMVSSDQSIIATKGFTSAAFTGLSKTEILHQLGFAHEVNKEIFGKSTAVFMPEEGWIDVYMPGILKKAGFQCVLISGKRIIDTHVKSHSFTTKVQKMRGLKNSEIYLMSSYADKENQMSLKMQNLLSGKINAQTLTNELFLSLQGEEKPVLLLKIDAEAPFLQDGPRSSIQRLRFFIEGLQNTGNFHFTLPLSIVQRCDEKNVVSLPPALLCDKRLLQLTNQAKATILEAEKKDPQSLAIRKAWKSLLFAHDYCFSEEYLSSLDPSNEVQYDNLTDLYIQACERAQLAMKNALEV